ncbi:MAG: hypothetical protein WKI04_01135 [Ferruginibacter sp.]
MKKQTPLLFTSNSKNVFVNITPEVKETIAFSLAGPCLKIFSTADLWNIRRQSKTWAQRRYL